MRQTGYVIMAVVAFCSLAHGQGFRNPPEGCAGLAQGGAFIAQADDASAVSYNPAGLVQLKGNNILFGGTAIFSTTHYRNGTTTADKEFNPGMLPYFYYATDLGKKNFRLGIGITSPYGQSTEWKQGQVRNWGFNPAGMSNVPYYAAMQTADLAATVAYKFTPEFSAGVGLNSYYSRLAVNYIAILPSPPTPPGTEDDAKLRTTGYAFAPSLGLMYKKPKYSIGVSYKQGFDIKYDGKIRLPGFTEGPADVKISFPSIAGAGVAFFPNPRWKVEADMEYLNYSVLDTISVTALGGSSQQVKNWKDCYTFSIGTEYKQSEKLKLRGGIAYVQTPVPNSTFEPSLPDSNRIAVSAGTEIGTRIGTIECAAVVSFFSERNAGGGTDYAGNFKTTGYFLTLGYKNRW